MTFEQFQATGHDVDDLGGLIKDWCLEGVAGRVYMGGLIFLEDCLRTEGDEPSARKRGRYYTVIGNAEYQSDDLESIERRLYDFAVSEGYTI